MKIEDDGTGYSSLLVLLQQLKDAVVPSRFQGRLVERALLLESALQGVVDIAEIYARQKEPGLAKGLYTEFSGHAGMAIFNRLNKAFTASSAAAAVRRAAPYSSRGGGGGGGGGGGDMRGRYGGGGGMNPNRGRDGFRGGPRDQGGFSRGDSPPRGRGFMNDRGGRGGYHMRGGRGNGRGRDFDRNHSRSFTR